MLSCTVRHLSAAELRSLHEDLGLVGQSAAQHHLLLCSHCRRRATVHDLLIEEETWDQPPQALVEPVLARAAAHFEGRLLFASADAKRASALLSELLAQRGERRVALVASERRFVSSALAERLLDQAAAGAADAPWESEQLAELALAIGGRLPRPGGVVRDEILGRSWTWIGEARRVRGDLPGSEAAHLGAVRHLEMLPLLSTARAEYCRLLARLRSEQGRDEEALALIARAAELYDDLGELERVAECRLEQGSMLLGELEAQAALPAFEEAAAGCSDPADFRAWLAARRGLALCYADLGCAGRARAILAELQRGAAVRPRVDQLRVALVEAEAAQALNDDEGAALLLAQVWPELHREGEVYMATFAAFDLARLHAEEGRPEEIAKLRQDPLLLTGLAEPLREVAVFALAFAEIHGVGGSELLEIAKVHLARARHNPALPFSILREPRCEVPWDRADLALRSNVAAYSGFDDEVAHLDADAIEPPSRRRLSWTAEAVMGIRLVFRDEQPTREMGPQRWRTPLAARPGGELR
jgi:tetratricopeptide (TPR) repeat protein